MRSCIACLPRRLIGPLRVGDEHALLAAVQPRAPAAELGGDGFGARAPARPRIALPALVSPASDRSPRTWPHPFPSLLSAEGERIAKFLARAGVCSRRDGEKLIAEGRVKLNGKVLDTPGSEGDGQGQGHASMAAWWARAEPTRLWRYHKPAGLVTTHRDPAGRATVFERLPEDLPRVISVGRLDLTSEGLLLLTNDGALARRLELPSNGWLRRYRARAFGRITQDELDALKHGISHRWRPLRADRGHARAPARAPMPGSALALTEGKNREVRRVLEALGLKVNRLIRIAYGPFQLGHAGARRWWRKFRRKVLKQQLGNALG